VEGIRGGIRESVEAVFGDLEGELPAGETRDAVAAMRREFAEPLRLAVAGRIKAGKSTLVNSMLRQRVAPTDIGECTRYVTWYRFGVPERLEAVLHDGSRVQRPLRSDGSMPPEIDVDPDLVHHLDVFLSIDDLRRLTVIDTPGLLSPTDHRSQGTAELLALDRDSRAAVSQADVLVLVMSMDVRVEDDDALAGFESQFDGLRRTALNAVGVLSKIDLLPRGDQDLQRAAEPVAAAIVDRLRVPLATVCPVATLLAESLDCGLLDERDLNLLVSSLGQMDVASRSRVLRTADRFADADIDGLPRALRLRLLERLDLSGIERVLEASGGPTEGSIREQLRRDSGIDRLRDDVLSVLARDADLLKCARLLTALSRLTNDAAARPQVLGALEALWLDPALHPVRLERARQIHASGEAFLPDELSRELHGLARPNTGAVPALSEALLAAGVSRWRSFANSGRAGRPEQEIADIVCRHYELTFERLRHPD
jgi:hypothetical protein